ncbi:MAG: SIS domain-containing protein [Sedimentisphaerales bacterium]|nr:SIS domain-containing protein [Sedimentisphaerales bacterium]
MIIDFSRKYLAELTETIRHLPLDVFEEIVNTILQAYEEERQIFIFGNGGSGSTASHFAADLNKGASAGLGRRFKVICLNDNIPTMLAYANDKSYEDIFVEQLKNFLMPKDVLIGISGSGNSQNVIKAIKYGNQKGAESIAFTGLGGGELAKIAKISIIAPTNSMQHAEDIHLVLTHMIMQVCLEEKSEQMADMCLVK